jgi:hypothetical protein
MFCRVILQKPLRGQDTGLRAVQNYVWARGAIDRLRQGSGIKILRFYADAPGNFSYLGLLARPVGASELFGPSRELNPFSINDSTCKDHDENECVPCVRLHHRCRMVSEAS